MAVELNVGDFLTDANAAATGPPFSCQCWFYIPASASGFAALTGVSASAGSHYMTMLALLSTNVLAFFFQGGSSLQFAQASGTISRNTWHHGLAVAAATNDQRIYLDGGAKGTNATDAGAPSGLSSTDIGIRNTSPPQWDGDARFADVAFWNVALGDDDAAALAAGVPAWRVRSEKLVYYSPLYAAPWIDWVHGAVWSATGTPMAFPHPGVMPAWRPWPLFDAPLPGVPGTPAVPVSIGYFGTVIQEASAIAGEISGIVGPTLPALPGASYEHRLPVDATDPEQGVLWAAKAERIDELHARVDFATLSPAETAQLLETWRCYGNTMPFTITMPGRGPELWLFAEQDLPIAHRGGGFTRSTVDLVRYRRTADL